MIWSLQRLPLCAICWHARLSDTSHTKHHQNLTHVSRRRGAGLEVSFRARLSILDAALSLQERDRRRRTLRGATSLHLISACVGQQNDNGPIRLPLARVRLAVWRVRNGCRGAGRCGEFLRYNRAESSSYDELSQEWNKRLSPWKRQAPG